MGFGHLGTGGGYFLHGNKLLAFPAAYQILRRVFAQAGNGDEGRTKLSVLNSKVGGIAFVEVNGQELKAPEVILIGNLQRGQKVLVLIRGVFIVFDGFNVAITASLPWVISTASKPPFWLRR